MKANDVIVNQIGEVFQVGKPLDSTYVGSVNVSQLARRLGKRSASKADVKAEFNRLLRKFVGSGAAYRFVQNVWALQRLNNGRFRVWGCKGKVIVSTEFREIVRDTKFWREARETCKRLGATFDVLDESPHCDKKSFDQGKTWVLGPRHGWKERQVDFQTELKPTASLAEALAVFKRMRVGTEQLWSKAGVNVF